MKKAESGFALLMTLIVLVILSMVVLGSIKVNILNERASGNYMERALAYQAAEQALQQGKLFLVDNSAICFDGTVGCTITAGAIAALPDTTVLSSVLPTVWDSSKSKSVSLVSNQASNGAFMVTRLADTTLTRANGEVVEGCKAYSIIGRGVGKGNSETLLQTVSWLCPT